jgi:hypothetical protein
MRAVIVLLALALAACGNDPSSADDLLTRRDPIAPGTECPHGGTAVQAGADTDGDGVLDDDEIEQTEVVCDPGAGDTLTREDPIPAGALCPSGGTAVHTGVDDDGDGVLDDDEIDDTVNVCAADEILEGNFTGADWDDPDRVAALQAARVVTGSLDVAGVTGAIALPKLELVGGDLAVTAQLVSLHVDALRLIGGDVYLDPATIDNLTFPALERIGGSLEVDYNGADDLLSAPALTAIGGSATLGFLCFGTLDVPSLASVGGDLFFDESAFDEVHLDALTTVEGDFTIWNPALQALELPALRTVGGELSDLSATSLERIEMPQLDSLGGLDLYEAPILDTLTLTSLTTVTGRLWIDDAPQLGSLALPSLLSVGDDVFVATTPALTAFSAPQLRELNADAGGDINVHSLLLYQTAISQLSLPSLQTAGGTINVREQPSLTAIDLPVLTRAEALFADTDPLLVSIHAPLLTQTLSFDVAYVPALVDVDLSALQRLTYLTLQGCGLTDLAGFPSLQWVGALSIHDLDHLTDLSGPTELSAISRLEIHDCDVLTSLTGLSGVTAIGGDVSIVANGALASMDGVAGLHAINGRLTIQANATLTNLDDLAALTWVGGPVTITGNTQLPQAEIDQLLAQLSP